MEVKKIRIEIKNRFTGKILFEYEKVDNTVKETVTEAVKRGAYLRDADLRGADLRGADLRDADLRDADLRGADLGGADLGGADLRDADLSGAYLRGADLRDADLRDADLRGADLGGADLGGADLRDADLRGANLSGAYLRGAKELPFMPMACPSDGAFVGWKKVKDGDYTFLVKLQIPEDSKRSSSTGTKCRCSKAVVLDIIDLDDTDNKVTKCVNKSYGQDTVYEVGKEVLPDKFDDCRWNECSNGIHFFINRQEAVEYDV